MIVWSAKAKYLGIYIISGTKFKCCFEQAKIKFYKSANAILGKLGKHDNISVSVHFVASIALPMLTYSLEAFALNKFELNSLDHPPIVQDI